MWITMPESSVPVVREADVVVAGGGPAGFGAALASARSGASTLLIERYGSLGGVGTNSMVAGFASGFHDGKRQIIGGAFGEMRERLYEQGALLKTDSFEPFDPDRLSFYYMKTLLDAGVSLQLHTFVTDVAMNGDRIEAVIIESKSGRQAIKAHTFIDATGDADVASRAGVEFEIGRPSDGRMQPVSFMYALGGVDIGKVIREEIAKPFNGHISGMDHIIFEGHPDRVALAKERGFLINLPRNEIALAWSLPGRPDVVYVNFSRIQDVNGTKTEDLIRAEIEGRSQVDEGLAFFRHFMPGFENCFLLRTAAQAGVRESRRIVGRYTLTEDDVLRTKQFDDVVAQAHYMIDIHDPVGQGTRSVKLSQGSSYDIPYRSLLQDKVGNLLVAGRCISATHEAFSSLRVMSISMATGEAAGTAASLCVRNNVSPGELDPGLLQRKLLSNGAILE